MVLFHLCYDLRFIYGRQLAFFSPPFIDIWRASISWTFLFVAGCMCVFTRNELRRAGRYLLCALAIYAITSAVAVDTPISFGIIYCMGFCTLFEALLDRLHLSPEGLAPAAVLFAVFLLLLHVPRGSIDVFGAHIMLPRWLYASDALSALGFPGPHFASGDYYPPIPFLFMYLTGVSVGRWWHRVGYPRALERLHVAPLEWVGQHALPIYLLHQPLLLGLCTLIDYLA